MKQVGHSIGKCDVDGVSVQVMLSSVKAIMEIFFISFVTGKLSCTRPVRRERRK